MLFTPEQLAQKKVEITKALGLKNQPVNVNPEQAGEILDTSTNTLAVWRTTGRYSLPYTKVSRRIAYPLSGLAEFLLKRTVMHTGENIQNSNAK